MSQEITTLSPVSYPYATRDETAVIAVVFLYVQLFHDHMPMSLETAKQQHHIIIYQNSLRPRSRPLYAWQYTKQSTHPYSWFHCL
jgi:hypothetical protein